MRTLLTSTCLALLALPGAALAQSTPVAGLELGINEAAARPLVDAACGAVERVEIADTRLPAALTSEVYLKCTGLELADGAQVDAALFTFADDALILLEARGHAGALTPEGDPMVSIEGFDVYERGRIVTRPDADQAWLLSPASLQTFMMFWDNPIWTVAQPVAPDADYFLPPEIVFGAAFDERMAALESVCPLLRVQDIEEIWLGTSPAVQRQIDCMGYEIAGYPRRLEFVFGDGQLEQMWILFGAGDIPRLREFLTATYGPAIHVDETYEVFDDWRIALRKDNPEILMGSDRLAAIWARDGLD
tara:strand:- start:1571 stop:2485 length:915 start_codon:yes stop_codon:yes gene_type:complete